MCDLACLVRDLLPLSLLPLSLLPLSLLPLSLLPLLPSLLLMLLLFLPLPLPPILLLPLSIVITCTANAAFPGANITAGTAGTDGTAAATIALLLLLLLLLLLPPLPCCCCCHHCPAAAAATIALLLLLPPLPCCCCCCHHWRRLASDPLLSGVSHVVVDEVHERSLQGDVLMALLQRIAAARNKAADAAAAAAGDDISSSTHPRQQPQQQRLKIILMSATLDANIYSSYYWGCPVVSCPGRTFPVTVQFLEDVYAATGYVLAPDSRAALRAGSTAAAAAAAKRKASARGNAGVCHMVPAFNACNVSFLLQWTLLFVWTRLTL
jgi:hypothetical protein